LPAGRRARPRRALPGTARAVASRRRIPTRMCSPSNATSASKTSRGRWPIARAIARTI
jgi:hypothetical protein